MQSSPVKMSTSDLMSAADQQISKMKDLMYKTLLKLERMTVSPHEVLEELSGKFNDEKANNDDDNSNNKISLLVKNKVGVWGWCKKGHELADMSYFGQKWYDDKCYGCGANTGNVYECESCMNYDKVFNIDNYDETFSKYLWCQECGTTHNPESVQKDMERNRQIQQRVIRTLKANPQIAIDLLTGLKNKNSLVHLLNEISVDKNKFRYSLYVFDIDGFKTLNEKLGHDGADQKLLAMGNILRHFEHKTGDEFKEEQLGIERCWCFRQGGDEFAIVTEQDGRTPIHKQELFYKSFNKEINSLDVNISVGMCCMGLDRYPSPGSNFKKAQDWLSFADKGLYEAKNFGKNGIRIYDDNQKKIVKAFK